MVVWHRYVGIRVLVFVSGGRGHLTLPRCGECKHTSSVSRSGPECSSLPRTHDPPTPPGERVGSPCLPAGRHCTVEPNPLSVLPAFMVHQYIRGLGPWSMLPPNMVHHSTAARCVPGPVLSAFWVLDLGFWKFLPLRAPRSSSKFRAQGFGNWDFGDSYPCELLAPARQQARHAVPRWVPHPPVGVNQVSQVPRLEIRPPTKG
jgi:hypothetical protein